MDHAPPPALLIGADAHDWTRDYFLWIPLLLASWRLAWKFQDPFISDWDGFDYTVYAVQNLPSTLGLGRALFLGYNHLLWEIAHRLLGVPLEHAYLVFRYGVIAQAGPAIVGFYALTKELTASRLAAAISASIVALSPFFITYSGRVMSEIPAFLLLFWSLWWMFRSLRKGKTKGFLVSSLLVGVSANVREFAVFYLWIIPVVGRVYGMRWKTAGVALVLAVGGALAGSAFWALYFPEYYLPAVTRWWILSAKERRIHNVTSHNFFFLRTFAYQCSCAATLIGPIALIWLWRRRELRGLWLFGMAGLGTSVVLLVNHDLSVNPRYLMMGLPGLAAVSGWALAELFKWRADVAGGLLIGLAFLTAGVFTHLGKENYDQTWNARAAQRYLAGIDYLPSNSVFIVGARTPLVNFYSALGARPGWGTIQPGSGWPDEMLARVIEGHVAANRPVFVDFNRDLWQLGERQTRREEIGLEMLRRECQLELVHDQLYRVRSCRRR
ncbi:MAG: glycosyltransferase family 39 protein [Acidobacteriota bacterium]